MNSPAYRRVVLVFGLLAIALGFAILVRTASGGGGSVGWAIGESYGVRVIPRIVRARKAGRAIVDEAIRRGSEIIVMGGPRRVRLRAGRRQIFGDTVDFVLKHAPCRVMVAASREAVA